MTCPARIDSLIVGATGKSYVAAFCNRVDGHPDLHVASLGDDYLVLGLALEVWDDNGRRYLPHDPEHGIAITDARAERPRPVIR